MAEHELHPFTSPIPKRISAERRGKRALIKKGTGCIRQGYKLLVKIVRILDSVIFET